ncbi:hypothetical protein EJ05DRAFT_422288, partial [Pseudovirgaria hyperparasitica]
KRQSDATSLKIEGDEEEPAEPQSFQRSSSPAALNRNKGATYENVRDGGINKMQRFSLYETSSRFYLVGGDVMDKHFRVLKVDRTAPPGQLQITEDDIVYDKREMNQLLNAIDDGNKGSGGLKLKCSSWGILGFIRFTEAYYMLLITKRTQVAIIGGHYIYRVDGTDLVPLTTGSTSRFQSNRNPEEARFLGILNNLDLTKGFYFSYSYNITRTLQDNIMRERNAIKDGKRRAKRDFNDMFVWNNYLLAPAFGAVKNLYDWCFPITHGFVDQSSLDVFGRRIHITIIARRSRFFAGARFLKRGANDLGYVANDVETEQIISEVLTTSFHAPGPRLYANPTYTSYVQHRGSIPLYWSQDNTGVTPKPDITLNMIDPFYSAAALHFDNLFERYGAPVYALNLIKARERTPRESKLLYEYQNAIAYLNQTLPEDKKIMYEAFDMSRASKTRGQDVIGTLEILAERVLDKTGFFHNGDNDLHTSKIQNGVARTNCIDCLDRTNAAQFVIGKRALGRQLQALGVISGSTVEYDSDCVNIFTHMFHDHGDTIAIQYGGSHLVNTMATYRKLNHWQSHSRDLVESFKRYYHNSFLDSQRQEAYNLFLGHYIFSQGQPFLWDLTTDYYLHHTHPRSWSNKRRSYIQWYTPGYLEPRTMPEIEGPAPKYHDKNLSFFDDYWMEYYRPLAISSFLKIFQFRMNSTINYLPEKIDGQYDLSPFHPRKLPPGETSREREKKVRKGVTIVDPNSDPEKRTSTLPYSPRYQPSPVKQTSILRSESGTYGLPLLTTSWPNTGTSTSGSVPSARNSLLLADKNAMSQWTLNQLMHHSLHPSVTPAEEEEYEHYVSHPLNLPLVTSYPTPDDYATNQDFVDYIPYTELQSVFGLEDIVEGVQSHTHSRSVFPTTSEHDFGLQRQATHSRSRSMPQTKAEAQAARDVARDEQYTLAQTPVQRIAPQHSQRSKQEPSEEDIAEYTAFLEVAENPLTVTEADGDKKRYKAYRQWLRGKSLFKQSKIDPEWKDTFGV